jgi:hypothetical protein
VFPPTLLPDLLIELWERPGTELVTETDVEFTAVVGVVGKIEPLGTWEAGTATAMADGAGVGVGC